MKAVAYLGVTNHMEDMVKGVLDLKDVVFYLTFIGFGLFLAQQSVESQRWRA
jgi:ABC-2 type transport system permease protein